MKPVVILMLACALWGCATPKGSTGSDDLAPSLTQPCAPPHLLPERDLTRGEVVEKWAADRQSLVICRSRHVALVAAIGR